MDLTGLWTMLEPGSVSDPPPTVKPMNDFSVRRGSDESAWSDGAHWSDDAQCSDDAQWSDEVSVTSDGSVTTGDLAIDCSSCLARPAACGDCIVTVLLGPVGSVNDVERAAFAVLADSGLVPPLRLVTDVEGVA